MSAFEESDSIPGPSFLFATDFIHGAGVVIFHRSSSRVVIVQDRADPRAGWFFPKGRKDVGETLPETACREGEEESGYPNRLLPVRIPTRQPPRDGSYANAAKRSILSGGKAEIPLSTEALYTHLMPFPRGRSWPKGGLYILSWFVAEVTDEDVERIEREQSRRVEVEDEKKEQTWEEWVNEGNLPNGIKGGNKELKPLDPHELQYKAELVSYDVARERLKRNWVMQSLFETALVLVKDLDNGRTDDAATVAQNTEATTQEV